MAWACVGFFFALVTVFIEDLRKLRVYPKFQQCYIRTKMAPKLDVTPMSEW